VFAGTRVAVPRWGGRSIGILNPRARVMLSKGKIYVILDAENTNVETDADVVTSGKFRGGIRHSDISSGGKEGFGKWPVAKTVRKKNTYWMRGSRRNAHSTSGGGCYRIQGQNEVNAGQTKLNKEEEGEPGW